MIDKPLPNFTVDRWTPASRLFVWVALLVIILLGLAPAVMNAGVVDRMTALFVYIILAAMWNALAGYGGLVSIGQQLFFGLGAYFTIRVANLGLDPFVSLIIASFIVGVLSYPISFFMLKLRGGEFAIGMWVLASLAHLLVNLDPLIQGETGISLISLNEYEIAFRQTTIYLMSLIAMLTVLSLLFVLLRGRSGIAIQSIRDDEEAAASLGVRAAGTKRMLFVLAAFGTGFAGALWLASATSFQPKTYFSVQWTAYMIFMVLVGGIGRFEGAILGAIVFFLIETWFGGTGVWYLIGLGLVAVLVSLFFPKGIWGYVESKFDIQLLPIGYRLKLVEPKRTKKTKKEGN